MPTTADTPFSTYPRRDSELVEDSGSVLAGRRHQMIQLVDMQLAADLENRSV